MAQKDFILNLGKLLIATAWADGQLTTHEINALKELLFLLPEISGQEWMELELYMASPVGEEERQQLLGRVLNGIGTASDKALVLDTLQKVVGEEGKNDDPEGSLVERLRQDIERKNTGFFTHLTRPLRKALQVRTSQWTGQEGRERRLEDFIKNTIYFQLVSDMKTRGLSLSLTDQEIRKICLAAGLMARVAWADQDFSEREQSSMIQALMEGWGMLKDEAALIVDMSRHRIMKGLDLSRLSKGFCDCATIAERKSFLNVLFAIANAADKTSFQEIEEIRSIANGLQLGHQDFIDAKLTISREDRHGL